MRSISLALALAVLAAGCDAGKQADANRAPAAASATGKACTGIVSAVERLACYDAAAGGPPAQTMQPPPMAAAGSSNRGKASVKPPEIVGLVSLNEAARVAGETGFRLSHKGEALPGRWSVVISAPAMGGSAEAPILAISCLSNISRLQLLASRPVDPNRMNIRLLLDGKPISRPLPWQVLEDGTVVDAGRGLVAIEQLRHLVGAGGRLQVESDYPPFSDLVFDATNLHALMKQQREACHW
ncbi:type VI secretion system-associated protein VasI [Burkholderia sola]|uniref:type VI secretion system-associated protein VasI n=1 Tax=Burkholderia TaxID=32008 RepID=UPI001AE2ACCA|nr:type VI secretion system-associated protein VasI [Burkholderia sp. AcTa6-5]MBP0714312.1 type VI secretion system-associated protein TagO [Burkholderia sp. AcTa6-5]